jgi:hypothetical protein
MEKVWASPNPLVIDFENLSLGYKECIQPVILEGQYLQILE